MNRPPTSGSAPLVVTICAACLVAVLAYAQQPAEAAALQAAEGAYAERHWEDAIAAFETYIVDYPNSDQLKRAHLRLAQAHGQAAHDDLARQYYSKLIALDPDDTYANQGVSNWGNLYVRRYQYREAAQMCEEVMRMYPGTRAAEMANYLIGNYLYAEKRYADAINGYTRFLDDFPKSVYHRSALRQLIDLLLRESRSDEAEALLETYISAAPDDSQVLGQLAQVYAEQERYGDAVRMIERALDRKPGDMQLLESLGTAYVRSGDRDNARDAWLRMAGSDAPTYSTHQRIANLFKRHGFYDEAATHYQAAITLQPAVAYLYTQLADVHRIRGDIPEALRVHVGSLLHLGLAPAARLPVLTAIGELYPVAQAAQAFEDMAGIVRQEVGAGVDSLPKALLTLAEARYMVGDYDASLALFERLSRAAADNGAVMEQYAAALARRAVHGAAASFYAALVRLYPAAPAVPTWWVGAGTAMAAQDRPLDAIVAFQNAIAADPTRARTMTADLSLARVLLDGAHDPDGALDRLRVARKHPRLSQSRLAIDLLIAEAHVLRGAYPEAEALLTRGSWGGPATASRAKYLLGELRLREGRFDEATAAYTLVERSYPSSDWANDALDRLTLMQANAGQEAALTSYVGALSLRALGDTDGSARECEAVVLAAASAPVAQDALMLLAQLAAGRDDFAAAADYYARLAAREGHLADRALFELAALHSRRDEAPRAKLAYERLLERSPTGAYAVSARAGLRSLNAASP